MKRSDSRIVRPSQWRGAKLSGRWQRLVRTLLFGGGLLLGLTLVLTFQFLPSRYNLNEGDVSVYTIKSPEKVSYISQIRTREERQRAVAAVPEVYVFRTDIIEEQRQTAGDVLRQISDIRRDTSPREVKREAIKNIPDLNLPAAIVDDVIDFDELAWRAVIADTLRVIDRVMLTQITERQVADVRNGIPALVDSSLPDRQEAAVGELARQFVRANYLVDVDATTKAQREAMDRVEPVRVTIERGETILRDGQIVHAEDLEKLQAAGLRNPTIRWADIAGIFLMMFALVAGFCLYLYRMRPATFDNPALLAVLALLLILTPVAAKLVVSGRDANTNYAYVFPVAAVSIALAILLDASVAIVATFILAVTVGMISASSFEIAVMTLAGGVIGLVGVQRMDRVSTIFRASIFVAIANISVIVGYQLANGETDNQRLVILAFSGLTNGALVGLVALGLMAFFGHVFGITTTISLLELAHPNQPLFRRLLSEAPGTYHHSVVVANLSERAAEVVNADTLLVRIGAYYHDIGKLVRPYAFIENQIDGHNIHDQLDPLTSARLIIAHVSEGLEMSRRERFPQAIRDLIAQHHGTCLVQYFYRQARQGAEGEVDESQFRYPGPKPQTREAAIMMLADGVEATVRATPDHSIESIRGIVDRTVQDRLQEGQLDECDLTLKDLERIRNSFVTVLQGIYHPRVEYPPPVSTVERRTEIAKTR